MSTDSYYTRRTSIQFEKLIQILRHFPYKWRASDIIFNGKYVLTIINIKICIVKLTNKWKFNLGNQILLKGLIILFIYFCCQYLLAEN